MYKEKNYSFNRDYSLFKKDDLADIDSSFTDPGFDKWSLSLNKNETEKKSKSTFSSSRALIMSAERTGISEINYYSWTMYESQKVLLIGKQLNKFEDTKTVGYNKQIE